MTSILGRPSLPTINSPRSFSTATPLKQPDPKLTVPGSRDSFEAGPSLFASTLTRADAVNHHVTLAGTRPPGPAPTLEQLQKDFEAKGLPPEDALRMAEAALEQLGQPGPLAGNEQYEALRAQFLAEGCRPADAHALAVQELKAGLSPEQQDTFKAMKSELLSKGLRPFDAENFALAIALKG